MNINGKEVRPCVHSGDPFPQDFALRSGYKVALAEQHPVRVTNLCLVLHSTELTFAVDTVDECDDPVQVEMIEEGRLSQKGLDDRSGVGDAGGFNQHPIEGEAAFLRLNDECMQRTRQVAANGAAQAAVGELNHGLRALCNQEFGIDADCAILVLDDRGTLIVLLAQDAIDQCRLATAEKSRDDTHGRGQAHGHDEPPLLLRRRASPAFSRVSLTLNAIAVPYSINWYRRAAAGP